MQLRNSGNNFGAIPKALHWLTVILVAVAWLLGVFGDELPKGGTRGAGLLIHISAGLAILALLLARLAWRSWDPPPLAEATTLGAWLDRAGQFAHYALYALLIAVPVAGIVLQFARGETLSVFGLTEIPSPWMKDRAFSGNVKEVHELLAHALVILAAFHAAAALIHHWIFRDRTLVRMLPGSDR